MLHSSELRNELQSLKSDITRVLAGKGEQLVGASKTTIDDLSKQLKAALDDLGETLTHEEEHVGQMVSDRPIATLASAFALGVVVGFMLRRT